MLLNAHTTCKKINISFTCIFPDGFSSIDETIYI